MSTPGGSFSYSYDTSGRLASLENPFGETSSWQYQANNWPASQTLANGIQTIYAYDPKGELTDLSNQTTGASPTVLSSYAEAAQGGYDGAGDRLGATATLPAAPASYSGSTAYTYSASGQLTGENSGRNGGYVSAFGYDGGAATGAGDPTTFRGVGHSFNADNQDTSNAYDGDGNPTTYSGSSLGFDA